LIPNAAHDLGWRLSQRNDETDHNYLVRRATIALSVTHPVVLSELTSHAGERPDVIGWKAGVSTLIECKASLSDLMANRFKNHGDGMGVFRWFLFPPGIISLDAFLETEFAQQGWGFAVLTDQLKQVAFISKGKPFAPDRFSEIIMLTSALRRIKTRDFITVREPGIEIE
jgi:hypothetical protein